VVNEKYRACLDDVEGKGLLKMKCLFRGGIFVKYESIREGFV